MGNALDKCRHHEGRDINYMKDEGHLFKNEKDGQDLVLAITRFALELYKEQGKRSKGNLFMSPLSISAVLSMAYLGARGKTLEEMKKTLHFDAIEDAKVHQAFSDLINHLKKCHKESAFQLHMANRLYGDLEESFKILEEFQNACRNHYDSEPIPVRFRRAKDKAITAINNWVEENTNQKIKNMVSSNNINAFTVLVLVNAIYFKSEWHHQFSEDETEEADFFVTPNETIRVQMMFQQIENASYYYSSDLSCQVLQLPYKSGAQRPYKSGALSMFILLPDKTSSSLEDLERKLTVDHLMNINSGFQDYHLDVNVWLPKFKMEENIELKEVLGDMGMKSIFDRGSADLSGIAVTTRDLLLYASAVVHKTFVDVNEGGTEAAAATYVVTDECEADAPGEDPVVVEFRADHPFLFFIREYKAKTILFMGRAFAPKHSS